MGCDLVSFFRILLKIATRWLTGKQSPGDADILGTGTWRCIHTYMHYVHRNITWTAQVECTCTLMLYVRNKEPSASSNICELTQQY